MVWYGMVWYDVVCTCCVDELVPPSEVVELPARIKLEACDPINHESNGDSPFLFWIRDVFCTLLGPDSKTHLKPRVMAPF